MNATDAEFDFRGIEIQISRQQHIPAIFSAT